MLGVEFWKINVTWSDMLLGHKIKCFILEDRIEKIIMIWNLESNLLVTTEQ